MRLLRNGAVAASAVFSAITISPVAAGEFSSDLSELAVVSAQDALDGAVDAAAGDADFTSAYFDGATLVVLTTDPSGTKAAMAKAIPVGADVRLVASAAPRRELLAIQAKVEASIEDLAASGVQIESVGVDDRVGRLRMGVEGPGPAQSESLTATFGPLVDVVVEPRLQTFACSRTDCGTKGGLDAKSPTPAGWACTTGFLIRVNATGAKRMLTAGHCVYESGGIGNQGSWRNWATTLTWGKNLAYSVGGSGPVDSGFFGLSSLPTSLNQFFASGGNDTRSIVGVLHNSAQTVGKQICFGGYASTWRCGNITYTDQTWSTAYGLLRHQWRIDKMSSYGDSGAGMLYTNSLGDDYAAGTLVGGNDNCIFDCFTVYSTADWIESYFQVTVCRNSSCT